MSDEQFIFAEEETETKIINNYKWKVIIADDEEEIHSVTKMVLNNYSFDGSGLELLSAYTGKETTYEEMMNSDMKLGPDTFIMGNIGFIEKAIVPVPGTLERR